MRLLDGLLMVERLVLEVYLEAATLATSFQYACVLTVATLVHQLPIRGDFAVAATKKP
jgi:hypothetical protein